MEKNCYIFTGGTVDCLAEAPGDGDFIICADSGYITAKRFGFVPDLLVGDFDSLDLSTVDKNELEKIEKITVPAVKDDTDTQLAVDIAISRGANKITIIGGLGGRLDHTLSNVFLLEYIYDKGIDCVLTDGQSVGRILVAHGEEQKLIVKKKYKYLSLLSLSDKCVGVGVTGVFYPLSDANICRKYSYAISNEITSDYATVSLKSGRMLIVESRD